jgi:hypothetical protein
MGVEIDDSHWILCIAEKPPKDQGYLLRQQQNY